MANATVATRPTNVGNAPKPVSTVEGPTGQREPPTPPKVAEPPKTTGDVAAGKAKGVAVTVDYTVGTVTVTVPGMDPLVYAMGDRAGMSDVQWHAVGIGLKNMVRDSYADAKTDDQRYAMAARKMERLRAGIVGGGEGISAELWDLSTCVMSAYGKADRDAVLKWLGVTANLAFARLDAKVQAELQALYRKRSGDGAAASAAAAGLDAIR